jgi:hypothetical protein
MRTIASLLVALATAAVLAASAGSHSPTKMTIASGVDPAFSQFYVAKEPGCGQRTGST